MSGHANNSVQKKTNSTQKSDMSVKKNVLDNNEVLSKKFSRERSLPTTKVRHIMECSPNSEGLRMTSEAIAAVSRAAEAFVELLTLGAQEKSTHNRVTYNDLSQFVHSKEELNFIQDILPNKQKFSEVSKQIRKSKR